MKSTYQEELYTTPLDRNSEFYKSQERRAAKLAAEIERGITTNIHLAEERGQVSARFPYMDAEEMCFRCVCVPLKMSQVVGTEEMDEEDRYGAVVRTNEKKKKPPPGLGGGTGKYVPPQKRAQMVRHPLFRNSLFREPYSRLSALQESEKHDKPDRYASRAAIFNFANYTYFASAE